MHPNSNLGEVNCQPEAKADFQANESGLARDTVLNATAPN